MLILTPGDVRYCQLSDNSQSSEKIYPGLSYRGFFFVLLACFTHKQIKTARVKCRQFLEGDEPVTALIVKERDRITLWVEARDKNCYLPEPKLVTNLDNNSNDRLKSISLKHFLVVLSFLIL